MIVSQLSSVQNCGSEKLLDGFFSKSATFIQNVTKFKDRISHNANSLLKLLTFTISNRWKNVFESLSIDFQRFYKKVISIPKTLLRLEKKYLAYSQPYK